MRRPYVDSVFDRLVLRRNVDNGIRGKGCELPVLLGLRHAPQVLDASLITAMERSRASEVDALCDGQRDGRVADDDGARSSYRKSEAEGGEERSGREHVDPGTVYPVSTPSCL